MCFSIFLFNFDCLEFNFIFLIAVLFGRVEYEYKNSSCYA